LKPLLGKLEAGIKSKLQSEVSLSNVLTQEKAFTVKARECFELQVDIYRLQYRLSLSCEWKPMFGKKKYWSTKVEAWIGQFSRPCRAIPRQRECGCDEGDSIHGALDLSGPGSELGEPYLVRDRLLVAFTTGVSVDDGKVLLRDGQGGDAHWPPSDETPRDWTIDERQSEEELLRPFLDTPSFTMPVDALPEYLTFLVGLQTGTTVTVNVRVPLRV